MRFPISLIIAALLFSFVTPAYGTQFDCILRNRDFQKPPRQGVISNKDVQKNSKSLKGVETAEQNKVTQKRHVTVNDEQAWKESLLFRKAILEERIKVLQSELNDVNTRVLQNRPINPLTVGDPYYVDPKMREQKSLLKTQLINAQLEYQTVLDKLGKQ